MQFEPASRSSGACGQRWRRRVATVLAIVASAGPAAAAAELAVGTALELEAALAGARPGATIRLRAGEYLVERTLQVPDGVALVGPGRMSLDRDGAPSALEPADVATLRAAPTLAGDLLTLGDRTLLRGVRVVVPVRDVDGERVPSGNAVVLGSRRPGDRAIATLQDCEVLTQSELGMVADGPAGRALVLLTRNPIDGPPHAGARLQLLVDRSIVRAPHGNALFANNFAPRGELVVEVRGSLVEGITAVSGGTSRPDRVSDARTTFRSSGTLYRRAAEGIDLLGWMIYGGSGVPFAAPGLAAGPGSDRNVTYVESRADRIEGFQTAILAAGYRRVADHSGPGHDNRVELVVRESSLRSTGDEAADLVLLGAIGQPTAGGSVVLPPGRGNIVRADLSRTRGSGERSNRFLDQEGPVDATDADHGNRLEIAGSLTAFEQSNPSIRPGPPASAFEADDR